MAKRNRGSNRPGQRHADRHVPGRPQSRPADRPASRLSDEEEARAAELEDRIVTQEREAELGRSRGRDRDRDRSRDREADRAARKASQGLLAVKAAEEYGYVVRDVRRIVEVGALLTAILIVVFVLVDVAHVIRIG
jgi:hypothetical protein